MVAKKLTEKAKGYVENVSRGINKERSAIMAGASINSIPRFEENQLVQAELAKIRKAVVENTGITREQIATMFMEAAEFARLLGDPMSLIAAARELGKMLGHYAPEVKKNIHGIDKNELRKALKDMNDEDLYRLANAKVIDGESHRVPDEDVPGVPAIEAPKPVLPEGGGVS